MTWKVLSFLLVVATASAHVVKSKSSVMVKHNLPEHHGHHGELAHIGDKPENHEEYAWAYPSYEFHYKVEDDHTHDYKGQHEIRHGDDVKGEYWLVQPDGYKRIVKYHTDEKGGFNAKVDYEKVFEVHGHKHHEDEVKPVVEEPAREAEEPRVEEKQEERREEPKEEPREEPREERREEPKEERKEESNEETESSEERELGKEEEREEEPKSAPKGHKKIIESYEMKAHHGHKPNEHVPQAWAYPSYEFHYRVEDDQTHDHKSQHEIRHGDEVKGEYSFIQPDGYKRMVKYHTDEKGGFKAKVSYEKVFEVHVRTRDIEHDHHVQEAEQVV